MRVQCYSRYLKQYKVDVKLDLDTHADIGVLQDQTDLAGGATSELCMTLIWASLYMRVTDACFPWIMTCGRTHHLGLPAHCHPGIFTQMRASVVLLIRFSPL